MAFGMNFFRKYQGRFLLVIAVFLMIVWFVGGPIMRMLQPEPSAGTIFGEGVSYDMYQQTLNVLQLLRNHRPSDDEIWRFLVMEHEADRLGVRVTEDEILFAVRQWVKQAMGGANVKLDDAYKLILNQLRTSDAAVRQAMARQLRVGKVRSMVGGAAVVTDIDAWRAFVEERATLRLKAVRLPLENYQSQVPAPDDAALAAYYDANKSAYLVPAKAAIEYIAAFKSDFEKLFPVSDDEVAAYYEEHKIDYLKDVVNQSTDSQLAASTDSQFVASTDAGLAADQLVSTLRDLAEGQSASSTDSQTSPADDDIYKPLSEVAPDIRQALTNTKARDAITYAQVDAGQEKDVSLQKIAETYGLPYFTAGPFQKGDRAAIPDLADATTPERPPVQVIDDIFNRRAGDYQSAEGEKGCFLYRVTSIEPEHEPPLGDVREEVLTNHIKSEAEKLATAEAADVLQDVKANGWDKYSKDVKFEFLDMSVGSSGKLAVLFKAAISRAKDEFGGPTACADGVFVFQVADRIEPKADDFEKEKAFLKFRLSLTNRYGLIQEWEDDLYKRADVKTNMGSSEGSPQSSAPAMPFYY